MEKAKKNFGFEPIYDLNYMIKEQIDLLKEWSSTGRARSAS